MRGTRAAGRPSTTLRPANGPARSNGADAAAPTRTRIVLDTSVLIADPACVHSFGDNDVVVPLTVVEELDELKTRPDDVGRAARAALRTLEELRVRHGGSLAEPVPVGEGTIRIEINGIQKHLLIEHGLDPNVPDNRIIGAALGQAAQAHTIVVSNDAALRIKAAHLGVAAMEHQPSRRACARPIGWSVIESTYEVIDCLYAAGAVTVTAVDVGHHHRRERVRRVALRFAVGARTAGPRRVRPVVARGPRGVGLAAAWQGATVRARAVARSRDRRRRPRRASRHRQDVAGDRRRARAGRRAVALRTGRRLPAAGAGRPRRRRLPPRWARREARSVDVGDPRRDRGA